VKEVEHDGSALLLDSRFYALAAICAGEKVRASQAARAIVPSIVAASAVDSLGQLGSHHVYFVAQRANLELNVCHVSPQVRDIRLQSNDPRFHPFATASRAG
jgi:hypothetical protein